MSCACVSLSVCVTPQVTNTGSLATGRAAFADAQDYYHDAWLSLVPNDDTTEDIARDIDGYAGSRAG